MIWYTNSKLKAEESLVPSAESILDTLRLEGEAMACTGGCSLAQKSFILAAFRGDKQLFQQPDREECLNIKMDDELTDPPLLKVLPATAAANCGVSSDFCHRCYRIGPPPDLYDLVQEMGRTDRDRRLPPGWNCFEMHVSWPTVVSVYVRIMQTQAKNKEGHYFFAFIRS